MAASIDVAVEAGRRFMKELRRHRQVDTGAIQAGVAEICRKRRQQPMHICTLAVPGRQPMHGCGVAQRVQTRGAPTVIFATDSGGLEQPLKSMIDIVLPDLCSISVRKEGGLHSFRQRTVRASFGISPQGIPKLGWNGNEATLVELGVPHSQHCVRKVHIAHGQMQRLTGSQSSSVQDQEQCTARRFSSRTAAHIAAEV